MLGELVALLDCNVGRSTATRPALSSATTSHTIPGAEPGMQLDLIVNQVTSA